VFTPVLAKHTKSFNLIDTLSVGVDRIQRNFEPLQRQVEFWRKTQITDDTANQDAKLIVVDPNLEGTVNRVCQMLSHDKTRLRARKIEGLECKADGRLMFVKAKAEEIDSKKMMALLDYGRPETQSKK
jgi:hypothetical protein